MLGEKSDTLVLQLIFRIHDCAAASHKSNVLLVLLLVGVKRVQISQRDARLVQSPPFVVFTGFHHFFDESQAYAFVPPDQITDANLFGLRA